MFQNPQQTPARLVLFLVGFVLFVFMTFTVAQTATDPKMVKGKPYLIAGQADTPVNSAMASLDYTAVHSSPVLMPSETSNQSQGVHTADTQPTKAAPGHDKHAAPTTNPAVVKTASAGNHAQPVAAGKRHN